MSPSRALAPPDGFETAEAGVWSVVARPGMVKEACAFLDRLQAADVMKPAVAERGRLRGRTALITGRGESGTGFVVKLLRRGGLGGRARGGFHGRRRMLAEIALAEEAVRRGIPTAQVLFGATARPEGGREIALLATREIEGTESLAEILAAPHAGREEEAVRRRAIQAAGRAVRRAHDRGLDHADLNAGNVLITLPERGGREAGAAHVIDLGASRIGEIPGPGRRAANLVRLLRSAEKHFGGDPRRTRDAVAFLRGYVRGGPDRSRRFRGEVLRAVKRRLPAIALHRIGWSLSR